MSIKQLSATGDCTRSGADKRRWLLIYCTCCLWTWPALFGAHSCVVYYWQHQITASRAIWQSGQEAQQGG